MEEEEGKEKKKYEMEYSNSTLIRYMQCDRTFKRLGDMKKYKFNSVRIFGGRHSHQDSRTRHRVEGILPSDTSIRVIILYDQ